MTLFQQSADYATFANVLREATDRFPVRLLCYVLMPNHWHLVVWPKGDRDLSVFMAWLTATHSRRWHLAHGSVGTGTLYQGRFKAIAVKDDRHFLVVCRYVERNPARAGLVARAEDWKWSSAAWAPYWRGPRLDVWPVPRPADWEAHVNGPDSSADLRGVRDAITRGTPFGPAQWRIDTADRLDWSTGMRPAGRPPRVPRRGSF